MSNKASHLFVRSFSPELQKHLQKQGSLWDKLCKDIKEGDVFPAIRNNEMHFYHKGGRLLAFNNQGFRTNIKYALTLHNEIDWNGDIHESDLKKIERISDFASGYDGMKELWALYAGQESKAVAKLYAHFPYTRYPLSKIVVLDIEVSLSADIRKSKEDRQDRIDLVLLDTNSRKLLFVEAKLFDNGAIRARKGCTPNVVNQIENYRCQIKERESEILKSYIKYVNIINTLFHLNVPAPESIIAGVPLLIVGFDADQQKGRLSHNIKCLHLDHNVCCLKIGKSRGASCRALKSWFKQAQKFKNPPSGS